jgi:hypothetical protein
MMKRDKKRKTKRTKKSRKRTIRRSNPKTLLRVFEALNLSRRKRISPSAAAKAAGTTLPTLKRLAPDALIQNHSGGPIRIKPSDRYAAKVEILEKGVGPNVVSARGSRQRELAGQHRAVYMRVLRNIDPPSALDQFRGKKVGGHELVADYDELLAFGKAGYLSQLDTLYVLPGVGN